MINDKCNIRVGCRMSDETMTRITDNTGKYMDIMIRYDAYVARIVKKI